MYKLAEVIAAFTLTHVRHNRHMQYLSSAPNFRGGQLPPPLTWPSRVTDVWHFNGVQLSLSVVLGLSLACERPGLKSVWVSLGGRLKEF